MSEMYQYLESGLDYIWLQVGAGVQFSDRPSGRVVKIKDIEGLHRLIGTTLATGKRDLSGREIRFLRKEMLLSQSNLANLLGVTEQTVHRWEAAKADISKPAEALIRSLYLGQIEGGMINIKKSLQDLADLEDVIQGLKMSLRKLTNHKWELVNKAA